MKSSFFLFVLIIFSFVINVLAQSDLEKVQNFKSRYQQLEAAIKNASSLDECSIIAANIAKLKMDFANEKELLDKTLYPENFESSFSKIERSLEVRKGDFSQITELTAEVGSLQDKVSALSQENQGLLSQIRTLQIKSAKDAQTIASLQKLVAQLKANIQQRDELVRGIVDSLLSEFVKYPSGMNEAEKKNVFVKVDNGNLFYNIERTIADNVQFMKVTSMNAEELSDMKKQYKDFSKVWRQIGPKLADVYSSRSDKAAQISNIDAMFTDWNMKLNEEIWSQINKLFREKKVALLPFRNGDQFVNSVSSFVNDEIKNYGVKSSSESEKIFYAFTDSVYFKTVEPVWIPVLIENNMMTDANKDSIDAQIAKWKEKVIPHSQMNWVYIGAAALIVLLVFAYFLKRKKKSLKSFVDKEEQPL